MHDLNPSYEHLFRQIAHAGALVGQPVYVIGGFVRDYYLNRISKSGTCDIDLVTVGSGIRLASKVAEVLEGASLTTFKRFGTARVVWNAFILEFVGARKESYRSDSRKPLVEDGSLQDDQLRRDFTINALSWSLNNDDFGQLNDPFGGIADLKNRVIRTPVDPVTTFDDDPLRMLRAARFASQLLFDIEKSVLRAMKACSERLSIISMERIADEINKIVMSPEPSVGFRILFETGLLEHFFPELCQLHGVEEMYGLRHKDNFWHTLKVTDNVAIRSDNLWLRWSALLHDIAKPATKRFHPAQGWTFHGHDALGAAMVPRIFRRLTLPMDERMRYVQKLVRLHLRPIALVNETVTDSAVRRLIFEAGNDIDDLMLLCRADITSKNDRKIKQFLRNFDHVERRIVEVEEKDKLRNWKPPVNGNEIMTRFGLPPGRAVGELKNAVEEAILSGTIPNEREAALDFLDKLVQNTDPSTPKQNRSTQ